MAYIQHWNYNSIHKLDCLLNLGKSASVSSPVSKAEIICNEGLVIFDKSRERLLSVRGIEQKLCCLVLDLGLGWSMKAYSCVDDGMGKDISKVRNGNCFFLKKSPPTYPL